MGLQRHSASAAAKVWPSRQLNSRDGRRTSASNLGVFPAGAHGGARGCTMTYPGVPEISPGSPSTGVSRLGYWLAGCLLVVAAAVITLAVLGIVSWDRQIQDFQRVPAPGRGEVTFTRPGGYVLYVETRGTCCSWTINSQSGTFANWSLEGILVPVNVGPPVPVRNWDGAVVSYDVTGHAG